jgi:divalent metal cation (Fe/Co/Zn/Cd) transporter
MAAEAMLAIGAGIAARSVLLTAFGADSLIELLSGITLLWRLRVEFLGQDVARVERVEARATWISAVLLILLCVYVIATSIAGIAIRLRPEPSGIGIAVSALAIVVMPILARSKRRANRVIDSPSLRADIAESVTCAYLAGVTLIGVGVAAITGWWWIEYVAAIALLVWLVPEMREAVEAVQQGNAKHE